MTENEMATILHVDDQIAAREIVRSTLEREGHSVLPAASGEDAVQFARDKQPDLILLDRLMPGMDGMAVLKTLFEQAETRDIPVLMVSAIYTPRDVEKAFMAGAAGYLRKPYDRVELVREVERALKPRRRSGGAPAR